MAIRILIVEDDQRKLRSVSRTLNAIPGVSIEEVRDARDVVSAKRLLRSEVFDLLILDVSLPERADEEAKPDSGIRLLSELIERDDLYKVPSHIVGLTSYQELLDSAGPHFRDDLWQLLFYEESSTGWADQLRRKVRHVAHSARAPKVKAEYGCYLCIITALEDPELSEVLRLPWNWQAHVDESDGTVYHKGSFEKDGVRAEVVAAAAARMGMTAAAATAMKAVSRFQPRYLAMAGITAGIRGECELGDIVAADPSWDYGSGKWTSDGSQSRFEAAPHQVGLRSFIRGKLKLMAQQQILFDEIRRGYPEPQQSVLRMHVGPVASGAAVLADSTQLEVIRRQHRKLLGIEMETYAIMVAAEEALLPQPTAFSLKSVSDFADEQKSDKCRRYAAYTSANALRVYVERFL